MTPSISDPERDAFYAAALVGLRALEGRERRPRRFGADADARWRSFRGHLGLGERIDLLVRDAAVTWPAAFSPAVVFRLPYLAADEPFGPDWVNLGPPQAEGLWHSADGTPDLGACARALGVGETDVARPDLAPTSRLVAAGGSAVLALARRFAARPDLSWPDQVLVVAERPANRQLAGLVAPVLGTLAPTRLVAPGPDVGAVLKSAGFTAPGHAVTSTDAAPAARNFAASAARDFAARAARRG